MSAYAEDAQRRLGKLCASARAGHSRWRAEVARVLGQPPLDLDSARAAALADAATLALGAGVVGLAAGGTLSLMVIGV